MVALAFLAVVGIGTAALCAVVAALRKKERQRAHSTRDGHGVR